MKELELTYIAELGSYHGRIILHEGKRTHTTEGFLYFTKIEELEKFLNENPDNAETLFTIEDSQEIISKGKQIAKRLKLNFMHP